MVGTQHKFTADEINQIFKRQHSGCITQRAQGKGCLFVQWLERHAFVNAVHASSIMKAVNLIAETGAVQIDMLEVLGLPADKISDVIFLDIFTMGVQLGMQLAEEGYTYREIPDADES